MTRRILFILLLACVVVRAQDLPLPPPPSAEAPAVDIALLAQMRAARPAPAPVAVESTQGRPVSFGEPVVTQILGDVVRGASDRSVLEAQLFEQLRAALPGSDDYVLEQATLPDNIVLPAGGWSVRFDFRLPPRGIGRATYTAYLFDRASGETQRFSGTVTIDREATGLTVTRLVRRGETLGESDVQLLPTRLSLLPRGALDQIELAVGGEARRELRPGEWLTDQVLSTPNLLKRGQAVTMRLERGPLVITAPGVVQQPGGLGELVRVQNAQSKKEVYARVLSNDEVQVLY